MEQSTRAERIITMLRQATKGMVPPASITLVERYGRNPYIMLISCILSLRTKDTVSLPASIRLFEHAQTPEQMVAVSVQTIMDTIYPVGFYKRKAAGIIALSHELITRFGGQVPERFEELISLPGVGPKTANLVIAEGFGKSAICVDTHVHRISNRLGLVKTTTPEQTEIELKKVLPPEYWREYSALIVMWGQNICVPISPFCSKCPIFDLCERRGVERSR